MAGLSGETPGFAVSGLLPPLLPAPFFRRASFQAAIIERPSSLRPNGMIRLSSSLNLLSTRLKAGRKPLAQVWERLALACARPVLTVAGILSVQISNMLPRVNSRAPRRVRTSKRRSKAGNVDSREG